MSEPTNPVPTPAAVTGRRRRFTGAHPYPALPRSRLPLLRGVLWLTWAALLALVDAVRDLIPGNGRMRRRRYPAVDASTRSPVRPPSTSRPPRVPSLTPTG